jgi:hypothetical protein
MDIPSSVRQGLNKGLARERDILKVRSASSISDLPDANAGAIGN